MIDVAIAAIASGTVLGVARWARESFAAYLASTEPAPVDTERLDALEKRLTKAEARLMAQGMRPNG